MNWIKRFGKGAIAQLPGPIALALLDVMFWCLHANVRDFRRRQRRIYQMMGRPSTVMGGEFAGMRYIRRSNCSCLMPKLLGTYEMELAPAIRFIISRGSDLVVDIGSAEGYYAVGLALRMPAAHVICYDIYKPARYLLQKLARLNGVQDRILQRTLCTPADLQEALAGAKRPAVICDCEGAEDSLLDPQKTPDLARCVIVVELHEGLCHGVTDRVRKRFGHSHQIEHVASIPRHAELVPTKFNLRPVDALEAVNEDRVVSTEWFIMRPQCG